MSGFIANQPNGLYCRFSNVVDCPTHYNMTEEDYLSNFTGTISSREEGSDILNNYLHPFSDVIEKFSPINMSQEQFNNLVKKMSEQSKETELKTVK